MSTNVNLEAALGVLIFIGSCFVLMVALLVIAHALVTKRGARAKRALVAACGLMLLYLGVMLIFSFSSREKALARGEEKHFCEIDCHLAYAVTNVKKSKTVGAASAQAVARGVFYIVTVRTRFDEQTISPRRDNAPLTPNSRSATIFDAQGRAYGPSTEATRALELSGAGGTPIGTPLRPGESYTTEFVFDLPETAAAPVLLINEGELLTRFVIGHENSLFHKKTLFRLADASEQVWLDKMSLKYDAFRRRAEKAMLA